MPKRRSKVAKLPSGAFRLNLSTDNDEGLFAVTDDDGAVIWPPVCQPGELAAEFMFSAFEYVKLATYSVVPFVVILALNIAIIVRLRRSTPLLRHARYGTSVTGEAVSLNTVRHASATVIEHRRATGTCKSRQVTTTHTQQ